MAKPYREGATWAFRLRTNNQDIYRGSFSSEAAANRAMAEIKADLTSTTKIVGRGPYKTTLGTAFSCYALERLPFLKGADQDKNRINRYLRMVKLPIIRATKSESEEVGDDVKRYWEISLAHEVERTIPASLQAHRTAQSKQTLQSDRIRTQLAATNMADVTPYLVQMLIDAMRKEGAKPATIDHERAELRRLFSYARRIWNWRAPYCNPASDVIAPPIDNARDRILTNDEWKALAKELVLYPNPYALPIICLMLETAMRSCEPLSQATWGDVAWEQYVLCLKDGKTGKRDVPLGPGAIELLKELHSNSKKVSASDRIFPTTYQAIAKAWRVACQATGVQNAKLHDLRHTASTRYAREFNGNLPVIMQITGHKTVKMAMRYINLNAKDVAHLMHGDEGAIGKLPAGYKSKLSRGDDSDEKALPAPENHGNVVRVNFPRKTA